MPDPTGTSHPGLSVTEAAVMLGVSANTVRRWVGTGRLRSERITRPQGEIIRVFVDQSAGEVPKQVPPGEVPGDVPIKVPPTAPIQVPEAVRAEALAALISASIAPVVAPLVAQIDAQRQTIERQGDQLTTIAEELGKTRAERDAAVAAHASILAVQLTPAPDESPVSVWRRWWLLVLALAGFLVIVALLAWPR